MAPPHDRRVYEPTDPFNPERRRGIRSPYDDREVARLDRRFRVQLPPRQPVFNPASVHPTISSTNESSRESHGLGRDPHGRAGQASGSRAPSEWEVISFTPVNPKPAQSHHQRPEASNECQASGARAPNQGVPPRFQPIVPRPAPSQRQQSGASEVRQRRRPGDVVNNVGTRGLASTESSHRPINPHDLPIIRYAVDGKVVHMEMGLSPLTPAERLEWTHLRRRRETFSRRERRRQ